MDLELPKTYAVRSFIQMHNMIDDRKSVLCIRSVDRFGTST